MQIIRITLYKSSEEIREIEFKIGSLNIITGESRTGKTALIDIVDYCLGVNDCPIADGVKDKNVHWFSVTFQLDNEQLFVARMNPQVLNQDSTNAVYIEIGKEINTPLFDDIENNDTIDGLKILIANKLKLSENVHRPEQPTRDPLSVSIKHARFYSFQPQYLIDQPGHLFYHQAEQFVPQSMKDTLPYLIGAVREDSLRLEHRLTEKRKIYLKLLRQRKDSIRISTKVTDQAFELCEEAKELGLIENVTSIDTPDEALKALKKVIIWDGEAKDTNGENENFNQLIGRKRILRVELGNLTEDILISENYANEAEGYTDESINQKRRLNAIGLFDSTNSEHSENHEDCPICGNELNSVIPGANAINKAIEKLDNSLSEVITEQPRLRDYISNLISKRNEIQEEIKSINRSISKLYQQQEQLKSIKDLNIKRGKVIGRVELFLESADQLNPDSNLNGKINRLKNEIEELENKIGFEEKEQRVYAILNKINLQMSNWSKLLDVEDPNALIRFDLKKLTLYIDKEDRSIPMDKIGSGANWVSYHLLIHMALHKHFIQANRPTPRFLFLDQPSQAYYPPQYEEKPGQFQRSNDDQMVKQLYDFIAYVIEQLSPNFQVIITDHARIPEYENNIIEEWRNGKKLIPQSWYKV